ncbi:SHOCT domain-containing protein [Miniphocaeibacter massiliensis]|uniref:SHOCT domain-containing protein n=1 Tax=Miniphocaeibacter massiliensis TaxID=2041841 RepID=UPI0013EA0E7C|nr:SHOCT domain-containing protein [Miniphocaeibacter massiliensis]
MTENEIYNEIDYFRAKNIIDNMLELALIDEEEHSKIKELLKEEYTPFLMELLP